MISVQGGNTCLGNKMKMEGKPE